MKAFYFILTLTANKLFFQLIGQIAGFDINIGSGKINTVTNIFFIALAGFCLYLDNNLRNQSTKSNKNELPEFIPKEGYISEPQYILNQFELDIDSLIETKKELEKLIENCKFQIIEHKAEIEKINITLERFENELNFVNNEIKSLRNQKTNE